MNYINSNMSIVMCPDCKKTRDAVMTPGEGIIVTCSECLTKKYNSIYSDVNNKGIADTQIGDPVKSTVEYLYARGLLKENINYKFKEDAIIEEIKTYIDSTYQQHYMNKSGKQTLEDIIADGYGEGFVMGNLRKLVGRYGKKEGKNRKDLLKLAHYAVLALYIHDLETIEDK